MKDWLYDWGGFNAALFQAINAHHAGWADWLMRALTWAGDHDRFEFYIGALALVTWWQWARAPASASSRACVLALACFSVGYVIDGFLVVGLKSLFDFPRPPAIFSADALVVVGTPEFHHSFPSGHASFATLVAASLWPLATRPAARAALAAFAFGVCVSRPYLGFHFPADVLYGSLKTLLIVVAMRAALERIPGGARKPG
ncbi:MAG TPA: phosphatase PAP2 family protein [Burkholderiales bacterium]|nr:phosphatase PAP2 family protein [Burkholderiales bacterium]